MKEYTFESAMERLEQIVRALEGGQTNLEESLSAFEEGIGLVKLCTAKLDAAEQRVKILLADANGEYREENFQKTEENA